MDAYTEKLLVAGAGLLDRGHAARGVRLYLRALERHPDDTQLLLRLARHCAECGALPQAKVLYTSLAALFAAQGQPGKASQVQERLQELDAVLAARTRKKRSSSSPKRAREPKWSARGGQSTPGFLPFALGMCLVLLPLAQPDVAALLEGIPHSEPAGYLVDGRTRLAMSAPKLDDAVELRALVASLDWR